MCWSRGWLALSILAVWSSSARAQVRPLATEPAELTPRDTLRLEVGFEFFQEAEFPASGLAGDLARIGVLGLRYGAGERVELGIFWTVRQFLNVDERFTAPFSNSLNFAGNSTSDVGNLILATKLRLVQEGRRRPALAFRFATELPNTATEKGIGVDETNFEASILAEKQWRALRFVGNVGLAILGDPLSPGAQDDLVTYGIAALVAVNPDVRVVCDWHGRAGPGGVGTEEQSTIRTGLQVRSGSFVWDGAFILGLRATDPETGIAVGLTYDFDLSPEP